MAKSAGYFNADDFNDYKRKQGTCLPPRINVIAAACHIQQLFDAKKFTYGFMGGLPKLCLGYKREMPDLHVSYDDKDFERLKSKLESDRRVRISTGVNPLLPFKILVWTGPEYKDHGCSINTSIELDLVPSGACSTPGAGDLFKSLVLLGLKTASGRQMVFKSLNIQYLLATLLSYCKARGLSWDPRKDILYLCKNETVEMQRVCTRLNVKEVKEMFLGTSFFSRLHVQDQRLCYRMLLNTEPPPTMAITPPAPQPLAPLHFRQQDFEQINEIRVPRSRYRNASGRRSNCDGKADEGTMRDARPQSMDHLQDPRRLVHIQSIQCVNSAKPQSVFAVAAAKQACKSMTNLMAPHNMAPTPDASTRGIDKPTHQQQQQGSSRVGHISSQPFLDSQQRAHGSSRLEYGGGFQPAHMTVTNHSEDDGQAFSLGRRPLISRTDSTSTDSTGTLIQGMKSQKGSLHVVSLEGETVLLQKYFEDKSTLQHGRLHLVGPEGVYGAPEIPQKPQLQHQRHVSAPPPQTESTFVFELDVTAPVKPTFIAKLAANSGAVVSAEQRTTRKEEVLDNNTTVRPLNTRSTSAPIETGLLPASLVAGGMATYSRQSLTHIEHSDESTLGFSTRQTNAYMYSSYAFLQPVDSETSYVSSEEATDPIYEAYRPFITTNKLNRTDSVSSVYSPGHKRDVSNDSTASHNSDRLAKEYQELLNFEDGYGSN